MKEETLFKLYLNMANSNFLKFENLTLLTSWFNKTQISDSLVVVACGFDDGTL